jgi:phage host-nuclease inhibitor protein Gam
MDTYLYGLLGLSLAANAFSAINTLVANSKKRDDDNQRTISSVYDEMTRKIESEISSIHYAANDIRTEITKEIDDVRKEFNNNIDTLSRMIEDLTDKVYENQVYDLDNYTGTKGKTKVSRKSKKRN